MADVIHMEPQDLRDAADYIMSEEEEMMTHFNNIKSKLDIVCSDWKGAAQNAFVQSFEEIYDQMSDLIPETLQGVADMLDGAADTLETTDEEIASSISGA